jgi:hypothetical protein
VSIVLSDWILSLLFFIFRWVLHFWSPFSFLFCCFSCKLEIRNSIVLISKSVIHRNDIYSGERDLQFTVKMVVKRENNYEEDYTRSRKKKNNSELHCMI